MHETPDRPTKSIVLAIHGVGNHEAGDISGRIRDNIDRSRTGHDVSVHEFNWDQEAPSLPQLGALVSNGAYIDIRPEVGWAQRIPQRLEDAFLLLADVALVVLYVLALVAAPLAFYADAVIDNLKAPSDDLPPSELFVSTAGSIVMLSVGALLAAGCAALFGAIRGPIEQRPGQLAGAVRRAVLVIVRPLVVALSRPVSTSSPYLLAFVVLWVLAFAILSAATLIAGALTGGIENWRQLLGTTTFAILLVALAITARTLIAAGTAGAKVIADIFRYCADTAFRNYLHSHLESAVQQLPATGEPTRLIIAAHSLGSVLAIDSLLRSNAWHRFDEVVLVTMGSPLRRFFQRFFSGIHVPATTRETHELLIDSHAAFRWLNVYRRLDFVGTRIGDESSGVDDRCVRYWSILAWRDRLRFWSAHGGYWADDAVRDEIVKEIERPTRRHTAKRLDSATADLKAPSIIPWASVAAWWTAVAAAVAACVWIGVWTWSDFQETQAAIRDYRLSQIQSLVIDGTTASGRVVATLESSRLATPEGAVSLPSTRYAFSFDALDAPVVFQVSGPARPGSSEHLAFFDPAALNPLLGVDPDAGARFEADVEIRYSNRDPRRFIVMDARPTRVSHQTSPGSAIIGSTSVLWIPVAWLALGAAAGLPTVGGGVRPPRTLRAS